MLPDKLKLLQTLPFWDKLTPIQAETVLQGTYFVNYKAGDIIDNPSEKCIGMMYVVEGCIRAHILSDEGREVTLFTTHSNEVCMLTAACVIKHITFDTHISAETDTLAMIIGAPVFCRLKDDNIYVECYTLQRSTVHFSDVMATLQKLLFTSIDRRLALFLCEECSANGKSVTITHEQIAKNLGTAREVVSRMLKRFESEGYVTLSRGRITVNDRDSLWDMAN